MKQKRYLICKLKLEDGVSYNDYSPLGLGEQMEKKKVALVGGFLVSAINKSRRLVVSVRIPKLLYFNYTVSFEIIG